MLSEKFAEIYNHEQSLGAGASKLFDEVILTNINLDKKTTYKPNEIHLYKNLFDNYGNNELEKIRATIHREIRLREYTQCADLIESLAVIQYVLAKALWKYDIPLSSSNEKFTRDFDRLDIDDERKRLYDEIRSHA